MRKRLTLAVAIVLVVAGSWAILTGHGRREDPDRGAAVAAPEVSVAPALVRLVDDTSTFIGRLQAVHTVQVRPRVSGYVESLHFTEGALVKKDQLLFRIDPRPYKAEADRLAANLVQARAELLLAQSNAARARLLIEQHAVSREEADRQITAAQSAQAGVAATAAALDAAQLNLGFTWVRSPIDGRVSNALITQGNLVTSGDVLTSVVSVNPLYAYFDVDEHAYLRLLRARDSEHGEAIGVQAMMALADEDGFPHPGRVDFVDNQLRADSGTIRLRAVFDNSKGQYTPGLYVRMRLESGRPRSRVLVDDRAIGTDLSNKFVLVVGLDHKVSYSRVDIGPLFSGLRVVNGGLKADELVVIKGMQRIRPGMEVKSALVAMTANLSDVDRARIDGAASPAAGPVAMIRANARR